MSTVFARSLDHRARKRLRNEASRALAELIRMEKDLQIPSLINDEGAIQLATWVSGARTYLDMIHKAMEDQDGTAIS